MPICASGCVLDKHLRMWMQVNKELVAVHAVNMERGEGRQRTYGALTTAPTSCCYAMTAGEDSKSWMSERVADLTGTITCSR